MTNPTKHPLINWSEEQPKWQQVALRLLVNIGNADAIPDTEIAELRKILVFEDSVDSPDFLPIVESDIPYADKYEPITYLKSLGPVENIDKLASSQYPFEFVHPNGMTVIYGNNGSGKSGYARILKKLCRSQLKKNQTLTIRGDVTSNVTTDWTVNLSYGEMDCNNKEIITDLIWNKDRENEKFYSLKRIAFFDNQIANTYVDGDRELLYFPHELRLYSELANITQKFKEQDNKEISEKEMQLPALPETMEGTDIHKIVSKLNIENVSTLTKIDLQHVCTLDDKEQNKLNLLRIKKSQTPQEHKKVLLSAKNILTTLDIDIMKLMNVLKNEPLEILLKEYQIYLLAKSDAGKTVAGIAECMPINKGIGSDIWFEMFKAARQFAAQVYPEGKQPKIATGDYCVLCHLSLDANAKGRLREFDAFMDDALHKAVIIAKNTFEKHLNKIIALSTLIPKVLEQQLQLFADLSNANKQHVSSVIADVSTILFRHKEVINIFESKKFEDLSVIFIQDFILKCNIEAVISEINSEMERLDTLITVNSDGLSISEQEALSLLEDKVKCCEQKDNLEIRFKLLNQMKLINDRKGKVDTALITRQITKRIKILISDDLKAKYKKEIDSLNLSYLNISIGSKNPKGKPQIKSEIENLGRYNNSDILSEGEQRAVALAGFLTEVNETKNGHAIILDDPVSSLDWERRGLIANRLAEEAKKRQVIIFTHDYSFALQLKKLCDDKHQLCIEPYFKQCWIARQVIGKDLQFGLTEQNAIAWEFTNVGQRIISIEKTLCDLNDENIISDGSGTSEYDVKAQQIVILLRQTWERAVEEVVFNDVVQRLSPEVKTQKLREVQYDGNVDYRALHEGMSEISTPLHDTPGHGGSASRTLSQLKENLTSLKKWVDGLKERRKILRKSQKEIKTGCNN